MRKPLAAIYCRLSDEDRDKKNPGAESESIQNQRSMLLEYCVRMGWDLYQIYCDEDYSGADKSRPEWLRMLGDCESGRVDIVLCKTQSRFSREVEVTEKYISNKFPLWGIRFVAPYDNIDTDIKENKKARQIGGLINEWYLDDLSANVRRTLEHKKKKGQWTGSFAPYGYAADPGERNKLIIDPAAARVVREIFGMYLNGRGYISIAKTLNDRCIPNPTQYKRSCGLKFSTRGGSPTSGIWTGSTISRILRNEIYTGTMVQGKRKKLDYRHPQTAVPQDEWIRVPNTHEPVVDTETWDAVQAKLAVNRSRQQKLSGSRHPLSGKVWCALCGNGMWKISCRLSYGTYRYYKCKTVKESNTACSNNRGVRTDRLESAIVDSLNALLSEYYDPEAIKISPPENTGGDTAAILSAEKNKNTADIHRKRSAMALVYEDVSEGRLSREESVKLLEGYAREIRHREERNAAITLELDSLRANPAPDVNGVITSFKQISELSPEIVDELIHRIDVGPVADGAREISIFWSF